MLRRLAQRERRHRPVGAAPDRDGPASTAERLRALLPGQEVLFRLREQPMSVDRPGGGVTTRQTGDVVLPRTVLDRIWTPQYLERLARTYWRFLERISLGLLRVRYSPDAREVVFLCRPFVLLRFHAPEYSTAAECGMVTWRIDRGVLVSPRGRGRGFLRITVTRSDLEPPLNTALVTISSEVANFYPMIAGGGRFSKIGQVLYRVTQLRIHVVVTNRFLRSVARLDLAPSVVGSMRQLPREDEAA